MATPTTESLKALMTRKDDIEAEIKELGDLLESQQGVGIDGPLVDDEQFPRSDIDVYSVRHARHQIKCLQNDHKALMKEIERGLHQLHAETKVQQDLQNMDVDAQPLVTTRNPPFSVVSKVEPGSPASTAGLQSGDLIIQFGSITRTNFKDLGNIASVVKHSLGSSIPLTVERCGKELRLSLAPQTWSGRGVLGCNIELYKTEAES